MSEEKFSWNCDLQWDGTAPIFDGVTPLVDDPSGDGLNARVFSSMRKTDLQDMIGRFSTALGFSVTLGVTSSALAKGVLAFCIIGLTNPFKIKILSGKGLDPLLDDAILNEETGELKVPLGKFYSHCKAASLPSNIIDWLSDNGFCYTKDDMLIFRNNFKRGHVISRA